MNERDAILLDQYFNGLLTPGEARSVEARADSDPAFGEEFSLRQAMEAFPRKEAERETMVDLLKTIGKDYFKDEISDSPGLKVVRNNLRRWLALAASLALIAVAIWFLRQPEPKTPTYQEYARHAPLSLTVMGETEQVRTEAEAAFRQKDYSGALAALDQVLVAEPGNVKASFYRGICLLELDRTAEARAVFEPFAAGSSALREDAAWYVALSFLKEQNIEACKTELAKIRPGEAHYKEAQEILGN